MKKNITTKQAVEAYKILKDIKVKDVESSVAVTLWKDIKALRPIKEEYEKDVEEAKKTLQDEEFKSMNERLKKQIQVEADAKNSNTPLTAEQQEEARALNEYFANANKRGHDYFEELNNKAVEVDVENVAIETLVKTLKETEYSLSALESVEWICD